MLYSESLLIFLASASVVTAFPASHVKRQDAPPPPPPPGPIPSSSSVPEPLSTPSAAPSAPAASLATPTAGKMPTIWQGGKFRGSFLLGGESPVYLTMDTGSSPLWSRWTGGSADPNYQKAKSGLYEYTCPATPPDCSSVTPATPGCCSEGWTIAYGSSKNPDVTKGFYKTYDSVVAPEGNFPAGVDMSTYRNNKGGLLSGFSVPNQEVWLVDSSTRKDKARGAGICGLGFGTKGYSTLWQTAGFGFFTSHVPNSLPTDEWYFGFGVDDTSKRSGEVSYIPTTKTTMGHWYVDVSDNLILDGEDVPVPSVRTMLLDTGTPDTVFNREAVEAVYAKLQGGGCPEPTGSCTFNCSYYNTVQPDGTTPTMPEIKLPWDGTNYITLNTSPGSFYDSTLTNSEKCAGTLQRASATATTGVYGTAVYKSMYFLWDGANRKVGIARYASDVGGGGKSYVGGLVQEIIKAAAGLEGTVADALRKMLERLQQATTDGRRE